MSIFCWVALEQFVTITVVNEAQPANAQLISVTFSVLKLDKFKETRLPHPLNISYILFNLGVLKLLKSKFVRLLQL